jgi:hypothetical protein
MPANLHFIRPGVWDKTFRRLSKEAKVVAFYVWTGPTRISEGIFQVAPGHVVADTCLTEQEVLAAFDEVSTAKLIDYDADAEVVLDRLALKRNPLRNGRDEKTGEVKVDKRIPNAVKRFAQVPDSPLKVEFVALADVYSPDLADALRADSHYAYSQGTSDGPMQGTSDAPSDAPSDPAWDKVPSKVPPKVPSREESSRDEESRVETSARTEPVRAATPDPWTFPGDVASCVVCNRPCRSIDTEGRRRHPNCKVEVMA